MNNVANSILFQKQLCINFIIVIFSICPHDIHTITIKDILTTNSPLIRVPRDSKYTNRYDSRSEGSDKNLKPEENGEVSNSAGLGKRCARCENGYLDRYPERNRNYYDEDRRREYDRYDDRYYERDRYYDRDRYGDR